MSEIAQAFAKAKENSVQVSVTDKSLLTHEKELYSNGLLSNVTHKGSSSIWLESECKELDNLEFCNVYRPMGDKEILYLVEHNQLPNTQPYQAIMKGPPGRIYADKYLNGLSYSKIIIPFSKT